MRGLRALRALATAAPGRPNPHLYPPTTLSRFLSAQPEENDSESDHSNSIFDSSHYAIPNIDSSANTSSKTLPEPTWDEKYRERADRLVFGKETQKGKAKKLPEQQEEEDDEDDQRSRLLAKALLEAALEKPDDEDDEEVREEDQKSLAVGIIGAPNAGKSSLTNYMLGTKVSAVSRKTNTTTHEVLGVMTKGDTQICFFDTPGLMLTISGYPHKDIKARVESGWSGIPLYDLLMVVFDVHRHLTRLATLACELH
uniref:GTP-binding protein erg n=1 Tax=Rhizophora mucronata TaxID=61149 RepID=A0A2P2K806_RHIMU